MTDETPPGYPDQEAYEPPACPKCGHRAHVEWVNISTWEYPDRWLPVSVSHCGRTWAP